jgi:hypothetical protein
MVVAVSLIVVGPVDLFECMMMHGLTNPKLTQHNYENDQQDAPYRLIYYSNSARNVSRGFFARHHEHLTVFTVSGSVHPNCCRLVSWIR